MIIAVVAALALQASSTPAQSDNKAPASNQTASTTTQGKSKGTDDPNRQICKRQTPVGSSIEQRVCKTKAQWDEEAAAAQAIVSGYNVQSPH